MLGELSRGVSRIRSNPESLVDALIQAGQLEGALADAGLDDIRSASALTDTLALMLAGGQPRAGAPELAGRIAVPDTLRVSPPEGFTYYALHPLDFAQVTARIAQEPKVCAVVGIRSIGTTLSAMTLAGLKARGQKASRITVRPTGHPYCRTMEFTAKELAWIRQQIVAAAEFLVVDEGPGRSGSTFLAVAEALVRAGVPRESISLVGSRPADPASLCAHRAAERWNAFRFISAVPSVSRRFEGYLYVGGGNWRKFLLANEREWPESWTEMERLKFLSPDSCTLFKFEGMGQIGSEMRERAALLAAAGFCPPVSDAGDGFLAYARLDGRMPRAADVNACLLERIAGYCAFRASAFSTSPALPDSLRQMLEFNVRREFGAKLPLADDELFPQFPVIADGRMQPCEWIATDGGRFLKTDAISHGDDHFFPGPCDIAWDLAGAALEWRLGRDARQYLVDQFRRFSGINVFRPLEAHMLAYAVFRLGFCKMALPRVEDSLESGRLRAAYGFYRSEAGRLLESLSLSGPAQRSQLS